MKEIKERQTDRKKGGMIQSNKERKEKRSELSFSLLSLSKMSAALRTKDGDQDGYLTTDEVTSVVDSYNMVYRLGLGRDRLEEALRTCSNGTVVDFETLLHMLKQLAGHA